MTFSSAGRKLFGALAVILLVDIIVLALSSRINQFQEFFFVADLFPLALSIITLVVVVVMLFLDFAVQNSFTARPPFIIGTFSILSIFWLAFNAFSTSRWSHVPLSCGSIPVGYAAEKTWCQDLQALKAFIWVEWLLISFSLLFVTRYSIIQHCDGYKHIWGMSFSRFFPGPQEYGGDMGNNVFRTRRDFVQYQEKPW